MKRSSFLVQDSSYASSANSPELFTFVPQQCRYPMFSVCHDSLYYFDSLAWSFRLYKSPPFPITGHVCHGIILGLANLMVMLLLCSLVRLRGKESGSVANVYQELVDEKGLNVNEHP